MELSFLGEEIVYYTDETTICGMNYYGITIDDTLSEEAMNKVLYSTLTVVREDEYSFYDKKKFRLF